jgi:hypothetical protein
MHPQPSTNHAAAFPARPESEPGSQAQRAERGNPYGLGTYESYPPTDAHPPTPHTLSLSRRAQSEDPPKRASKKIVLIAHGFF